MYPDEIDYDRVEDDMYVAYMEEQIERERDAWAAYEYEHYLGAYTVWRDEALADNPDAAVTEEDYADYLISLKEQD